ncbi:hypothetical protein V1478_005536 [Vespula squamosa]|uniref:Uncharacterized protein n=1 Tax=Vespula squamosa TaxID=30214 RepID=A0ABD2BAL7_VESSQ
MATDWTTNTFGPILVLKIYTLGIDSLVNRILIFRRYTLSSQFCELKSPPILYYIISSKDRYHLPEGDNVEQTIARLFWNLTIGISGLVVPTIFILRICLH